MHKGELLGTAHLNAAAFLMGRPQLEIRLDYIHDMETLADRHMMNNAA